jgi:hypothetical protein
MLKTSDFEEMSLVHVAKSSGQGRYRHDRKPGIGRFYTVNGRVVVVILLRQGFLTLRNTVVTLVSCQNSSFWVFNYLVVQT